MNPIDIHRLQVLNDLVAQTIDIINQRNFAAAGYAPQQQWAGQIGGGLSHTPWANPWAQQWAQPQIPGIVPQYAPQYAQAIPWGVPTPLPGLSHTPFVDPRWAYAQHPYFPMPFVR